jgi:hypothetical protein
MTSGKTLATLQSLGFMPMNDGETFEIEFRDYMVRVIVIDGAITIHVQQLNNVNVWTQVLTNAPDSIVEQSIRLAVRDARNRPA